MKSLVEYIQEAQKQIVKPEFCSPQYDACFKLAYDGSFYSKRNNNIAPSDIDVFELYKWFEENRNKLSERVNFMVDFANELSAKSKKIEQIYKDGVKKGFFDPYLTSAGETKGIDNRKCMPGMAEAVAFLIATAHDTKFDNRLGKNWDIVNHLASEEVKKLMEFMKS